VSDLVERTGNVLVVEDDAAMRDLLVEELTDAGLSVSSAGHAGAGLELVRLERFDVIITDLRMPEMDGFDLIRGVANVPDRPHVVMITAFGSIETAIRAVKLGAYDYITKPFEIEELLLVVDKALSARQLETKVARLQREVEDRYGLGNIIAKSQAMRDVVSLVQRAAPSTASVLVTGESGTGKELVARAIHYNSTRSRGPFVAVNLAAVPESLIESELFGHKKGAFTDARTDKPGLFVEADNGTIFLDEIGELALPLQAKLLRVLQEHEVERLGGRQPIALDVRVIATTNRRLREEVQHKRFREDLYYRLNVFPLEIVALRSRREDIVPLAMRVLANHCRRRGRVPALHAEAAQRLLVHEWPGNVRELENVMQRALVLCDGDVISAEHLSFEPVTETAAASRAVPPPAKLLRTPIQQVPPGATELAVSLAVAEQQIILEALRNGQGNRERLAERLGISPRTLRYKLARMRAAGIDINAGARSVA